MAGEILYMTCGAGHLTVELRIAHRFGYSFSMRIRSIRLRSIFITSIR